MCAYTKRIPPEPTLAAVTAFASVSLAPVWMAGSTMEPGVGTTATEDLAGDAARIRLAASLRQLRRSRGLSQRALAAPLHVGAHSTIADYESGRRIPPVDVLRSYERLFAVPAGQLDGLRDRALAARSEAEFGRVVSLPPRQLPPVAPCFMGREHEIGQLNALLGRGRQPVTILRGMPGVGKTALASWWAQRNAGRFSDGVLYANLHGTEQVAAPVGAVAALGGILRAMGVTGDLPHSLDDRAGLFRTVVAARRVLVVIDNAQEPEQVRPLLPGGTHCRVLVASRKRLSGLQVRDGAAELMVGVLAPEGGTGLLRCLLGDYATAPDKPGCKGRSVMDHQIIEMARLCGYLPLALRVVAQRARERVAVGESAPAAIQHILGALTDPRTRLDTLDVADDPQSSVRRVLLWSYRRLPALAQTMLCALAPQAATPIEPASAAGLTGMSVTAARAALDTLAAAHLLDVSQGRYAMHELVRCLAREQAEIGQKR